MQYNILQSQSFKEAITLTATVDLQIFMKLQIIIMVITQLSQSYHGCRSLCKWRSPVKKKTKASKRLILNARLLWNLWQTQELSIPNKYTQHSWRYTKSPPGHPHLCPHPSWPSWALWRRTHEEDLTWQWWPSQSFPTAHSSKHPPTPAQQHIHLYVHFHPNAMLLWS